MKNVSEKPCHSSRTCFNKSEHVETNYTLQYKHNSSVDWDELDHRLIGKVNYFISSGFFFCLQMDN